jgi:hypothetical protein
MRRQIHHQLGVLFVSHISVAGDDIGLWHLNSSRPEVPPELIPQHTVFDTPTQQQHQQLKQPSARGYEC